MIRLLHDPAFVDACYADVDAALTGVDVTATERAWLTATPRAAWGVDAERPARVLAGLTEEFPVSVATSGKTASAFFHSTAFHTAVQEAGSIASAFGAWLGEDGAPIVVAVSRIESAIAQVRRAPRRPPPCAAGTRRLAPSAVVLDLPAGALDAFERLRFGATATVLDTSTERVLVQRVPATGEVTIEELPDALADLLAAARVPGPRATLIATARTLGADASEAEAIIGDLERDGLLL